MPAYSVRPLVVEGVDDDHAVDVIVHITIISSPRRRCQCQSPGPRRRPDPDHREVVILGPRGWCRAVRCRFQMLSMTRRPTQYTPAPTNFDEPVVLGHSPVPLAGALGASKPVGVAAAARACAAAVQRWGGSPRPGSGRSGRRRPTKWSVARGGLRQHLGEDERQVRRPASARAVELAHAERDVSPARPERLRMPSLMKNAVGLHGGEAGLAPHHRARRTTRVAQAVSRCRHDQQQARARTLDLSRASQGEAEAGCTDSD